MVGKETSKWLDRRLQNGWIGDCKMVGKETGKWLVRRLENGR
jgi:hypothetical protein